MSSLLARPAVTGITGFILSAAGAASSDGSIVPLILAVSGLVASVTSLGTLAWTVYSQQRDYDRPRRRRGR